ncbi:MAG: hypothetical protein CMP20_04650 [Rickettsiales bacterium]|nr:hypothetical protein [Rickettsiales bacterium]
MERQVKDWIHNHKLTLDSQYQQSLKSGKQSFGTRVPETWTLEHYYTFLDQTAQLFDGTVHFRFNDRCSIVFIANVFQ